MFRKDHISVEQHTRQLASRRVTITERRVPTHERLRTPKRLVTNKD